MTTTTRTTLKNVTIQNAAVYTGMKNKDTDGLYFPLFFDTVDPVTESQLLAMGRHRNDRGNFLLTNVCKPVITVKRSDYDRLLYDLDVLRARNMPPDSALNGIEADLVITTEIFPNGEKRFLLVEIILEV